MQKLYNHCIKMSFLAGFFGDKKAKTESCDREAHTCTGNPMENEYGNKFLNMSLDDKRKLYKCRDSYVTLQGNTLIPWRLLSKSKIVKSETKKKIKVDSEKICEIDDQLNEKVCLWQGDITRLEIDAIVNAANRSLLGGGGVDGCIHRAAGQSLVEECRLLHGCDTGQSKITSGHKLPAKYIIHTVGPIRKNRDELESCYKTTLKLVLKHNIRSIAFVCVATGIYGYPNLAAAHVALRTVRSWLEQNHQKIDKIIFCTFLGDDFHIYHELMRTIYFPCEKPVVQETAPCAGSKKTTNKREASSSTTEKTQSPPSEKPDAKQEDLDSTTSEGATKKEIAVSEDVKNTSSGGVTAEANTTSMSAAVSDKIMENAEQTPRDGAVEGQIDTETNSHNVSKETVGDDTKGATKKENAVSEDVKNTSSGGVTAEANSTSMSTAVSDKIMENAEQTPCDGAVEGQIDTETNSHNVSKETVGNDTKGATKKENAVSEDVKNTSSGGVTAEANITSMSVAVSDKIMENAEQTSRDGAVEGQIDTETNSHNVSKETVGDDTNNTNDVEGCKTDCLDLEYLAASHGKIVANENTASDQDSTNNLACGREQLLDNQSLPDEYRTDRSHPPSGENLPEGHLTSNENVKDSQQSGENPANIQPPSGEELQHNAHSSGETLTVGHLPNTDEPRFDGKTSTHGAELDNGEELMDVDADGESQMDVDSIGVVDSTERMDVVDQ